MPLDANSQRRQVKDVPLSEGEDHVIVTAGTSTDTDKTWDGVG